MAVKTKKGDFKEFIENCRQNVRHLMEERRGRDVEYGYYRGGMSGISHLAEREEPEDNPLQIGVRLCPTYCAVGYSYTMKGNHTLLHGTEGCAFLNKSFYDSIGGLGPGFGEFHTTAMGKADAFLGSEEKLKRAIVEIDRDYHPELITVIKSCASAIIGYSGCVRLD